jgi:hypothetical protein
VESEFISRPEEAQISLSFHSFQTSSVPTQRFIAEEEGGGGAEASAPRLKWMGCENGVILVC